MAAGQPRAGPAARAGLVSGVARAGAARVLFAALAAAPCARARLGGASGTIGTTVLELTNKDWSDGVVFCRGPVEGSLARVFLDAALTQPAVKSEIDCAVETSRAAREWGAGVPHGATFAMGLAKGETQRLYLAPDGRWPSGACWFQDAASAKAASTAKGPQFMSQAEFTIDVSGGGQVWYDISSVEGVSGGISMTYIDDWNRTSRAAAAPGKFQGGALRVVDAPRLGFKTVLSDKHTAGVCDCATWNRFDPEGTGCNSDACRAGCPGSLVEDACGQHRCRVFYAHRYESANSYCGWLAAEGAQTYCWAMDEWVCTDPSCGYGGSGQPKADCSDLPLGAVANTYSCGHGVAQPSGVPGQSFWVDGPGCTDKLVNGVPTNPAPARRGGRFSIVFEELRWLRAA